MPQRLLIWIAWIGIATLAIWLRLHDLEERPIHADEATGARILSTRLTDNSYAFNPHHFHGPLLSLSSVPLAELRGESQWPELTKLTLRLGPALAGILLVFTPLLWARRLGTTTALATAALLASSPLLVYYNRMYIHESLLTLFTMLGFAAAFRMVEKPTLLNGALTGLCVGLMFATKETFIISLLAWHAASGIYLLNRIYGWNQQRTNPTFNSYIKPTLLFVLFAGLCAGYFYTDGFKFPQGIIEAVRTYFVYETTAGHEKGMGYYFHLLLWPKHTLGIWWSEAIIGLLSIITCTIAFFNRAHLSTTLFIAMATFGHLIIYSLIGYKTPWLMLVPWAHACLLAGCAFRSIHTYSLLPKIILTTLLFTGIADQTRLSIHASGRLANDARNPYSYVPTSKDAEALETWLDDLAAQQSYQQLSPIAVVGNEYWPLPWYLRKFDKIAYWPEPNDQMQSYPIIFAMPSQVAAADLQLQNSHVPLPRGLRSNVAIILYLRNDIWDQWTKRAIP
jgi:uncharacterized protein (TIGR03663 family)